MKPFLSRYIQTLSSRGEENVQHMLAEAVLAKNDLDRLAERFSGQDSFFTGLSINNERPGGQISPNVMRINFRDAHIKVSELYRYINNLDSFINNISMLMGSEIQSLERDISMMEKMIENYAFLLSDNGSFNYGFIETFNDEKDRELDFNFAVPDRDGFRFGPTQSAVVKQSSGVLTLGSFNQDKVHALSISLLKTNVGAFVDASNDITNCLTTSFSAGWKVDISTPSPIVSSLPEARGVTGAQMMLGLTLSDSAPASRLEVQPFADRAIQIVRVIGFRDKDDKVGVELLSSPVTIDTPYVLNFPMINLYRFEILINQPTYIKKFHYKNRGEELYKHLNRSIKDAYPKRKYPRISGGAITRMHINNMIKDSGSVNINSSPRVNPLRNERFVKDISDIKIRSSLGVVSHKQKDTIDTHMIDLVWQSTRPWMANFANNDFLSTNSKNMSQTTHLLESAISFADRQSVITPSSSIHPASVSDKAYYYSLGITYIALSVGQTSNKGVHISKPLRSNGDIGQIRLKTSEINTVNTSADLDSDLMTSVEYSISNKSRPEQEEDWIPILPVDSTYVDGERLFFDVVGQAKLRFPANRNYRIELYKNHYSFGLDINRSFVYSKDTTSIVGINLDPGFYDSTDIFTVSYTPTLDYTLIDLSSSFSLPPLVSSHSDSGGGEDYVTTGERNTIRLRSTPYVDYDRIQTEPSYSPIVVTLKDGTNAKNLTFYESSGSQSDSQQIDFLDDSTVCFYHSKDSLIFNQPITENFRVYYQYLENNVRVRTILRSNSKQMSNPQVDYWHIKGKTRRSDKGSRSL